MSVLIGVGVASWPGSSGSSVGSSAAAVVAAVEPVYLGVCLLSFVFPAAATICKEHIFKTAARRMGGQQLDVLVVNAYCSTAQVGREGGQGAGACAASNAAEMGRRATAQEGLRHVDLSRPSACLGASAPTPSVCLLLLLSLLLSLLLPLLLPILLLSQAAFLLLLLPLTCRLKGLTLSELPAYLQAGATCLMGGTPACGADCVGAPLLPALYVAVNVVSVCVGVGRVNVSLCD
jgi:hypothetical protein